MSENNFSDYISECVNLGITNNKDILERAQTRIKELDKQLHEADALRAERQKLQKFLSDFTGAKIYRNRNQPNVPNIELNNSSEESIDLQIKICEIIDKEGPSSNRQLIQLAGTYLNDGLVLRAIKYLGTQDIIKRDSDLNLVPGVNWEKRPR